MQKTEFYDSYNCGYDLSSIIQKEIDDGWIVKHVIQIPFETYHGGDLFKPQIAVTIVFEKNIDEVLLHENTSK
jgi:hypothetical protein